MKSLILATSIIVLSALGSMGKSVESNSPVKLRSENKELKAVAELRVNFLGFKKEVEKEAAKLVLRRRVCHTICRIHMFNKFVPNEKITDLDILNGSSDINVRTPHHLKIGMQWFIAPPANNGTSSLNSGQWMTDVFLPHEFAHIIFKNIPKEERDKFIKLYNSMSKEEIKKFQEYNFWGVMFGHPDDGADELFASAFADIYGVEPSELAKLNQEVIKFVEPFVSPVKKARAKEKMCNMW